MTFDKEKAAALAALCDEALWGEIRRIAGEKGIKLGETVPEHADMEKMRNVFLHAERFRLTDAAAALRTYRNKYGK